MSLTDPILQFQQTRAQVPFQPPTVCTAEAFPILLAGVPALRKVPGLATLEDAGEAYFTSIPYCLSGEDRQKTREHLEQVYGITGRDSMAAFCQNELWVHPEYLDFESFWEGRPAFSLDELNPGARATFQRLSGFARQFQPFVGRRGFLAWDISETLGHLRMACACDLISPEEYRELSQHWVEQAAAFHSWDEYAVGLVCGAAYWAFRMGGDQGAEDAAAYLDLNLRLVRPAAGQQAGLGGPHVAPPPGEGLQALSARDAGAAPELGGAGRLSGHRPHHRPGEESGLLLPGEARRAQYPDSGWRFFSGEETDEYANDVNNVGVYALNTICNYDPDILPLLTAPYGTAYARGEDGKFHAEPFEAPEP